MDASTDTAALILAANAERARWLERLTAAYETGTISHAQYLLARYALDRSHGLRSCEIDAIYCTAFDSSETRATGNGAPLCRAVYSSRGGST